MSDDLTKEQKGLARLFIFTGVILVGFTFTTGIILGALVTAHEISAPLECPSAADIARVHHDYVDAQKQTAECEDTIEQCAALVQKLTE